MGVPPGAVGALDGGGHTMAEGTTKMASRVSAPAIEARKGDGAPVVMVTAYDAPSARIVDRAGVDIILVGDTLAMVVLGYDDTLQVTTDDMAHHVGAVARNQPPCPRRRRPPVAQLPRVDDPTPSATPPRWSAPAPGPSSSRAGASACPLCRPSSTPRSP